MYNSLEGKFKKLINLLTLANLTSNYKSNDKLNKRENQQSMLTNSIELGLKKYTYNSIYFGAKINFKNYDGWTPLLISSYLNNKNIVNLLIKNLANTEVKNVHGYNSLIYSSQNDHLENVKLLLLKNANINLKCEFDGLERTVPALVWVSIRHHRERRARRRGTRECTAQPVLRSIERPW